MKRKIILWLIGLCGLVFLLYQCDWKELYQSIKRISVSTLIIVLIMQLITIGLLMLQWNTMIKLIGVDSKWIDVLEVNMKGNFVDTVTPGAKMGGELARIYVLRKRLGISLSKGTLVVGLQKSLSLLSFLALSVFSLLWFCLNTRIQTKYMMLFGLGLVFLIFLLTLLIGVSIFPDKTQKIILKLPINEKMKEKIKDFVTNFHSALSSLQSSKRNFVEQLMLSTIIWVVFALKMYVLTQALDVRMDWLSIGAITYLTYMVGMIPLLPGSIGSFEGCMVGLLLLKGVELNVGIALTVLFRFTTFWFPFFLSLLYMGISEMMSLKNKIKLKSQKQRGKWSYKNYPVVRCIPCIITFSNMMLGIIAIFLAHSEDIKKNIAACICILIAAVTDKLDGWMARKLEAMSEFGKELDSLCDVISFGIAPVVIGLNMELGEYYLIYIISIIYIGSGVFRLARYNVIKQTSYFLGLPITIAGMSLSLIHLIYYYKLLRSTQMENHLYFTLTSMVVLSLLMISKIKIYGFKAKKS